MAQHHFFVVFFFLLVSNYESKNFHNSNLKASIRSMK